MNQTTSFPQDSPSSPGGLRQSDSAKQILRFITHKGDCLKADEEGERVDAGAKATWATRKHLSFMIHTAATAAARTTYRAAAAESKRSRLAAPQLGPGHEDVATTLLHGVRLHGTFSSGRKRLQIRVHLLRCEVLKVQVRVSGAAQKFILEGPAENDSAVPKLRMDRRST